uniref:Reverse transcriptase/retrotransposon-derived protein RNase H-like domain-containing protein n=1 Tax=Cannabis sativa TaxID=3483 RepID=A0A803Q1L4_CANSA
MLPDQMRCEFLGEDKTFPVIISASLSDVEREKLLRVLKKHMKVIGWTLADIKRISPSIVMHRILMEDGVKSTIVEQRRLNPLTKEVVRKGVLIWGDDGGNDEKNELIPTRTVTGWKIVSITGEADFCTIVITLNWDLPLKLMCDASDYAVGAVLEQRVDTVFRTIYYASRTLNYAQLNYSNIEKEMFAIVFACDKFRPYLIGNKVIMSTEIKDKKGTENLVVDQLSRLELQESSNMNELHINNEFLDEKLFLSKETVMTPWFADYVIFLAANVTPPDMSRQQLKKFFSDVNHYYWEEPILYSIVTIR